MDRKAAMDKIDKIKESIEAEDLIWTPFLGHRNEVFIWVN